MENNTLIVDITGLSRYHENLKNNVLTTKQDVISDLEDIRTGATAGANASADAQAKADAAQAAAIAAAATDATNKADAAQAAAEQKATDLNTAMNERVVKLEAIDHEKLASDASAAAVAAIVAGAESDFDTLKEVADWINSDTTGAAALQIKVSENAEAITDLTNDKQDVISDLETIRSGAAAGATAEATAKTYTDAEIVKVNATIEENERVTAESLTDLDTRVKDLKDITYNKTEVDEMIGNVIVVASDDDIDNLFN